MKSDVNLILREIEKEEKINKKSIKKLKEEMIKSKEEFSETISGLSLVL